MSNLNMHLFPPIRISTRRHFRRTYYLPKLSSLVPFSYHKLLRSDCHRFWDTCQFPVLKSIFYNLQILPHDPNGKRSANFRATGFLKLPYKKRTLFIYHKIKVTKFREIDFSEVKYACNFFY